MNGLRHTRGRYADERTLAPHIDPHWTGAALVELRLLGVGGRQIGSALAEVDSFCAESGQSAAEAFGAPEAYVRSLDLPADQPPMARELWPSIGSALVQATGMVAVTWAVAAWSAHAPVTFAAWHLAELALIVTSLLLVGRFHDSVIRFAVQRPFWWTWLAVMAYTLLHVGVIFGARQVAPGVLWDAPAGVVLAAGLVLLAVGALPRPPADDPVTGPLQQHPDRSWTTRLLASSSRWLIPVMTVVPVGVTLLAQR